LRPYEVVLILEANLEESQVQAILNRASETLTGAGASIDRTEKWGRRRFAYPIKKKLEGYYALLQVTSEPAPIDVLDRQLTLSDDVLRHKIVRVPEHKSGRAPGREAAAEAAPAEPQTTSAS
jgi:small subunit ribosomal protein S6